MCLAGILWPNADKRHVHAIFKLFPFPRILRHGDHLRGRATIPPKTVRQCAMCWRAGGGRDGRKRTMPDSHGNKHGPGKRKRFSQAFPVVQNSAPSLDSLSRGGPLDDSPLSPHGTTRLVMFNSISIPLPQICQDFSRPPQTAR